MGPIEKPKPTVARHASGADAVESDMRNGSEEARAPAVAAERMERGE